MKTIKLVLITITLSLGLTACTSEDDAPQMEVDPLAEYNLVTQVDANGHSLELYSDTDAFTTGYNKVYMRIKDDSDNSYFANPEISWMPLMHMESMNHSCPKSELLTSQENNTVVEGYVIFQMAGNTDEYWDITFTYALGGQEYTVTETIDVTAPSDGKQRVTSFVGADNVRYVLAMVAPSEPEVAVNDIHALLFTMESMMSFPMVENYSIALDPRMPGMANHSSPNNEDLTYDGNAHMYTGKLSLTMTGYWKLNLKLLNTDGEVLKGEDVTEENEASSLYWELEF